MQPMPHGSIETLLLEKCNSIEYNEIELAMQVGGIPNFWLSFWRYGGKNKSATNKIYG